MVNVDVDRQAVSATRLRGREHLRAGGLDVSDGSSYARHPRGSRPRSIRAPIRAAPSGTPAAKAPWLGSREGVCAVMPTASPDAAAAALAVGRGGE
jgi:hypothetical protein